VTTLGVGDVSIGRRRKLERMLTALAFASLLLAVGPFLAILAHLFSSLRVTEPIAAASASALLASLELSLMTVLLALPAGILGGVYIAELASPRLVRWAVLGNDTLAGIPPVVLGMFVYGVVVLPLGGFSLFAGAVALALSALPTIALSCAELLRLVPGAIREASLGLGLPRHRVIFLVLLRAVAPGLASIAALTFARALGEVGALLFTAGATRWLGASVDSAASPLPLEIFVAAQSGDIDSRGRAAAMTLTLLAVVSLAGVAGRVLRRGST
jgi:phosphate transport system permease protein